MKGQLTMSLYLLKMRERYQNTNKDKKGKILDEFCATGGYHRKSAIRALNYQPNPKRFVRRGQPKHYKAEELLTPLKRIWLVTDQLCSRRLKAAMPYWLPYYEKHCGKLPSQTRRQLLAMSSATIDRLLKPLRSRSRRGISGTKPGSILKTQIPIKSEEWNTTVPGFMEADTVAHCGESLAGDFVWSLTLTDIATTWTENRAMWGKGAASTLDAIQSIENQLPFPLKGFDSDNGCEFLNYHLVRYFSNKKIQFTRSRPYHKDDNAHVEQKNWTHVRQLFGYERFSQPRLVLLMNDLYANEISLFRNHFLPSFKLTSKKRIQGKIIKKYARPKTPYERVLLSTYVDHKMKMQLRNSHKQQDPFILHKKIQLKLQRIYSMVDLTNKKKRKAI